MTKPVRMAHPEKIAQLQLRLTDIEERIKTAEPMSYDLGCLLVGRERVTKRIAKEQRRWDRLQRRYVEGQPHVSVEETDVSLSVVS